MLMHYCMATVAEFLLNAQDSGHLAHGLLLNTHVQTFNWGKVGRETGSYSFLLYAHLIFMCREYNQGQTLKSDYAA